MDRRRPFADARSPLRPASTGTAHCLRAIPLTSSPLARSSRWHILPNSPLGSAHRRSASSLACPFWFESSNGLPTTAVRKSTPLATCSGYSVSQSSSRYSQGSSCYPSRGIPWCFSRFPERAEHYECYGRYVENQAPLEHSYVEPLCPTQPASASCRPQTALSATSVGSGRPRDELQRHAMSSASLPLSWRSYLYLYPWLTSEHGSSGALSGPSRSCSSCALGTMAVDGTKMCNWPSIVDQPSQWSTSSDYGDVDPARRYENNIN